MSIEYVVGRDYKDVDGVKWKLVYISSAGVKAFVTEYANGNIDNMNGSYCCRIVSEWPRTVTLNGEEVELEPWANYIAMDDNGMRFQFEKPPKPSDELFLEKRGNHKLIKFKNWKDSLIKL